MYSPVDKSDKTSLNAMSTPAQDFRGNDGSLVSALKTLLFFTVLMITLPIGLYFASKAYIFEASMGMSSNDSYFYGAIVAVVAVHFVLALFVYVAWNEGSRQWREGKQD
ncbi:vacuolar ATPase assembly integral membrane protein vma21 [Paramormyrops kingsleyae]|uniref:Vacuolar ATPase assembly factor VMA21 n=1 Tax=Paramormyrops kingsleyae TaxID=1676925 RepID=A0A3B3Q5H5_9TELE|nr:vacuolar ATPase assembly integral membrane protein VMA21 [Paramormyrops kingsleyae]